MVSIANRLAGCFVLLGALFIAPCLPLYADGTPVAASSTAGAMTGERIAVEPTPTWVVPASEGGRIDAVSNAMHYRVIDDQDRITGDSSTRYTHVVRVVDGTAGLETASQIQVEFDPTYQTLAFHHLDILRSGQRINKLDRSRIQFLQRETELERRIYDGRVTASIVLDDVRVGDEIDLAYSVHGANPVFGGRFVSGDWLASPRGPVANYQYRLLAPEHRNIHYRMVRSDVTVSTHVAQGIREMVFRRVAVPQLPTEPDAPSIAFMKDFVTLSEFADWADVARWGQSLFVEPSGPTPLVDRNVAEIRAKGSDRATQVREALRIVQTEIRYFGSEVGTGSQRPSPPEKVLERRFGDCKDKVFLLVAILHRLHISATPVLVSPELRGDLVTMLPSPLAFNHVIARVDLESSPLWLDATRSHQTGTLEDRQAVGLDKGLPLTSGTTDLADLPLAFSERRAIVEDTFHIPNFAEDAKLTSRITYRGELAETVRDVVATHPATEIQSQIDDPYIRFYPKIKVVGGIQVEDSKTDDAVTITQQFAIPDFWRLPRQSVLASDLAFWSVIEVFKVPSESPREQAFAIALPGVFEHRIVMAYAEDVFKSPNSDHFEAGDSHFAFHSSFVAEPRRVEYDASVQMRVNAIAPEDWSAYRDQVKQLWPRLAFATAVPTLPLAQASALLDELHAMDNDWRSGRIRATTKVQQYALVHVAVLSKEIGAGRLSPKLRAAALTMRGVENDKLGHFDAARADFDESLQLVPNDSATLTAAAMNAFSVGDQARALRLSTKVLDDHPADLEARRVRAQVYYLTKDYAASRADLTELLKDPVALRNGYPLILLGLTVRKMGGDEKQVIQPYLERESLTEWPRPLIDLALGKTGEDAVLATAKASDNAHEHLCEAYFYIGERHLADGDSQHAQDYFRRSMDQNVTEFVENTESRIELTKLDRQ